MQDDGSAGGGGRRPVPAVWGQGTGVLLGQPFGIPVRVAPTFLLLPALIGYFAAEPYIGRYEQGNSEAWQIGIAVAVALFLSVLLHELGHGTVGRAFGMPVRGIVLVGFGGYTDLGRAPSSAGREAAVSVSGPLVNIVLGAACLGGVLAVPDGSVAHVALVYTANLNFLLAAFNLLPGTPLDGGGVLRAAVWRLTGDRQRGSLVAAYGGVAIAVVVAILGVWLMSRRGGGIFALLVAVSIGTAAGQAVRSERMLRTLPGLALSRVMRPAIGVEGDTPLAEALRRAVTAGARAVYLVDRDGDPVAVMTGAAVDAVPEQRRPWVPLSSVARRLTPGTVLHADLAGGDLLEAVQAEPSSEYLVLGPDGRPVGVLVTVDLMAALGARRAGR